MLPLVSYAAIVRFVHYVGGSLHLFLHEVPASQWKTAAYIQYRLQTWEWLYLLKTDLHWMKNDLKST